MVLEKRKAANMSDNNKVYHDIPYLELAQRILDTGNDRGDRTGTGTRSLFAQQLRFDLGNAFPLLTTKLTPFWMIAEELLWFLRGETNIRPLVLRNVKIWNEWPYKAYLKAQGLTVPNSNSNEWKEGLAEFIAQIGNPEDDSFALKWGELGPVYGSQWRKWKTADGRTIDQIAFLIKELKSNPEGRAQVVSAWNPGEYEWLRENSLPPCHVFFQLYVANGKLSLELKQRSCDLFLGVPFNIASYALLLCILAYLAGLEVGEFIWDGGDVHIYNNHFEQMNLQLGRTPLPSPQLRIVGNVTDIDSFTLDNFKLIGYEHLGKIVAPIAV